MNRANKKRSILKTITWGIVATTDTILIARLLTGSWEFGLLISLVILYYLHERTWSNINWGFMNKKDKMVLLGNEVKV